MRILLVEDEERLGLLLSRALHEEGYEVDLCVDGRVALEQGEQIRYDLIVLDWTLPSMDGIEILRRWRSKGISTPVLLLSARGTVSERVQGLKAGADDYVVKPVELSELFARLEALIRRGTGHDRIRKVGDLELDAKSRSLRGWRQSESLSAREFSMMNMLFDRAGDVLARIEFLNDIWGKDFDGSPNVVDVYIGYLRSRMQDAGTHEVHLETVRGLGFRLKILRHKTVPADQAMGEKRQS